MSPRRLVDPASASTASLTVRIARLNARGLGVAEGPFDPSLTTARRLLVPGSLPGETLSVTTASSWRSLARVDGLHTPSLDRAEPGCARAADCPGCTLRQLRYPQELAFKRSGAAATLRRLGPAELPSLDDAPLNAALHVDGYRARAVARAFDSPGALCLGLAPYPWAARPIRLADCPAQDPLSRTLLARLEAMLASAGLAAFDEATGRAGLRWVMVHADAAVPAGARVVLLCSDAASAARVAELSFAALGASALVGVSPPPSFKLLREPPRLLSGSVLTEFRAGEQGCCFAAEPICWTPVAPSNVGSVLTQALDLLPPRPGLRLLELGCGVGTLSAAYVRGGAALIGVDQERCSVRCAEHNLSGQRSALPLVKNAALTRSREVAKVGTAEILGIHNCASAPLRELPDSALSSEPGPTHAATFRTGEARKGVRRALAHGERYDAVIVHTMRAAYGDEVMSLLKPLGAQQVLLVSPVTASLARDLAALARVGFVTRRVAWVDQLPRTASLMALALAERSE